MIWGMIAAKAKTGMNAATSGEIKTVSAALQQAGTLILMIAVASGINIYTSMDNFQAPSSPLLEQQNPSGRHLMSVDSHYKGGVAAAAFD
jgi:hypothetical protein